LLPVHVLLEIFRKSESPEQHIGAMLANEFIRLVKSMCGTANVVPRVAANNCDQTLLANDGIADRYDPNWF
jgi:hypothetical protein